jgi:hypothetical protein
MSSTNSINWVSHDRPFRNPCLTPRVLNTLAPFIVPILTVIFKISYESGTIPAIWKTANICPLFKKGKQIEALNYRES